MKFKFNVYMGSLIVMILGSTISLFAQSPILNWKEVTSQFGSLPNSIKVYESDNTYQDSAFKGFYVEVDTKDKSLHLDTDTTLFRRLTPKEFYARLNQPLIVVNSSFFEFKRNTNVNIVVKNGLPVSYNIQDIPGKGKDTLTYTHVLGAALGMDKKGSMDIAYTFTDSNSTKVMYQQLPMIAFKDSNAKLLNTDPHLSEMDVWKLKWANGGGPVLMRSGRINISNNEERKFAGKAINDYHPRTAMGYTTEGKLIIMAIQGRMKGIAVGATLNQMATFFEQLNCYEAINLDGGGSSCLLVNGKETIKPSDPTGQRPVPAVFFIK
ncbi:MAG: phosphodiester glycosidase family protein [Sediminibacterium sp.]